MNKHETNLIFGNLRTTLKDIAELNEHVGTALNATKEAEAAKSKRNFAAAIKYEEIANKAKKEAESLNKNRNARTAELASKTSTDYALRKKDVLGSGEL